jgi:hypothetical protein
MILAFKVSLEQGKIYIHKRQFFSTILVFFYIPFFVFIFYGFVLPFLLLVLIFCSNLHIFFLFELIIEINIFWSHELTTIFY